MSLMLMMRHHALLAAAAKKGGGGVVFPENYAAIDYLWNTGWSRDSAIPMGFSIRRPYVDGDKYVINCYLDSVIPEVTGYNNETCIISSRNCASSKNVSSNYPFLLSIKDRKLRVAFNNSTTGFYRKYYDVDNDDTIFGKDIVIETNVSKTIIKEKNGTILFTKDCPFSVNTGWDGSFGSYIFLASSNTNPFAGKIYNFKVYNNDNLIVDLHPCWDTRYINFDSIDKHTGFFDAVRNIIFDENNLGTGLENFNRHAFCRPPYVAPV